MNAPSLDSLRQEIDAIDGELHGLIGRQMAIFKPGVCIRVSAHIISRQMRKTAVPGKGP